MNSPIIVQLVHASKNYMKLMMKLGLFDDMCKLSLMQLEVSNSVGTKRGMVLEAELYQGGVLDQGPGLLASHFWKVDLKVGTVLVEKAGVLQPEVGGVKPGTAGQHLEGLVPSAEVEQGFLEGGLDGQRPTEVALIDGAGPRAHHRGTKFL